MNATANTRLGPVDLVAVERAFRVRSSAGLTPAERFAAVHIAHQKGMTPGTVETILGVSARDVKVITSTTEPPTDPQGNPLTINP